MGEILKDLKETLNGAPKADLTHVRRAFKIYTARANQYGEMKYDRANYLAPGKTDLDTAKMLRDYLRAVENHISYVVESLELVFLAEQESDKEALRSAFSLPDNERNGDYPASLLPHLAHACASLNMLVAKAALHGFIPADPGTPWLDKQR